MATNRGSLIKFLAECGHWLDCYSLEPTPEACSACAKQHVVQMAGGDALLPEPKRLSDTQRALADHKAKVDAKYAAMKGLTVEDATAGSRAEAAERRRKDRWLLVDPQGQIVGVMARWACGSAVEAFEDFYPKKRERRAAAEAGYRIEEDDKDGTRFAAYCEATKADKS